MMSLFAVSVNLIVLIALLHDENLVNAIPKPNSHHALPLFGSSVHEASDLISTFEVILINCFKLAVRLTTTRVNYKERLTSAIAKTLRIKPVYMKNILPDPTSSTHVPIPIYRRNELIEIVLFRSGRFEKPLSEAFEKPFSQHVGKILSLWSILAQITKTPKPELFGHDQKTLVPFFQTILDQLLDAGKAAFGNSFEQDHSFQIVVGTYPSLLYSHIKQMTASTVNAKTSPFKTTNDSICTIQMYPFIIKLEKYSARKRNSSNSNKKIDDDTSYSSNSRSQAPQQKTEEVDGNPRYYEKLRKLPVEDKDKRIAEIKERIDLYKNEISSKKASL